MSQLGLKLPRDLRAEALAFWERSATRPTYGDLARHLRVPVGEAKRVWDVLVRGVR